MTFARLLRSNLGFHWRSNLAVLLGVVVGTAVLTGALLVGDSLRGSLRDLTVRQLGWVQNVLISGRFVRQELANELGAGRVAPVVLLQGSAENDEAHRRVAKVAIYGVDARFWDEPVEKGAWESEDGTLAINATLARELGAKVGDSITLRLQKASDVPRETWLGRSDASDTVGTVTVKVSEILADDSAGGRFNLRPAAVKPRNAFLPLATLQKALGLGKRVNALLVGPGDPKELQENLAKHLTLDDWGLTLTDPQTRAERFFRSLNPRNDKDTLPRARWGDRVPEELARENKNGVLTREQFVAYYEKNHNYLSLESRQLLLDRAVEAAAKEAAEESRLAAAPTLVYLANTISTERVELGAFAAALDPAPLSVLRAATPAYFRIPYSVVAAVPPEKPAPVASPFAPSFSERQLANDHIILADWKESPLPVHEGDRVVLQYFDPERHGHLGERSALFALASASKAPAPIAAPLLPLRGASADPDLTPTFPGITDKLDLRNWDPPFPYDNRRVKPRDEEYWKRYRTTPKAYISLAAGQELWQSRFGRLTSVRLAVPHDRTAKEASADFRRAFLAHLTPEKGGLVFTPILDDALKASSGGTDFSMLFLGFSFFLIAAALLLVGLLTRLSLDRRAAEAGLLFAVGYRRRTVRRLLLVEGTLLAAGGALVGIVAGVGYAWLMLELLRRLWPGGLEESFLRLHVTPLSFALGYGFALTVSVGTIFWAVRALGKAAPTRLLQGEVRAEETTQAAGRKRRVSTYMLEAAMVGAIACLVAGGYVRDPEMKAGMFFGSGFLLLVAGLTVVWAWMKRGTHRPVKGHGWPALARLGVRNATRNPLRSLLTAGLLAAAAFLIVAVDAFRRKPEADFLNKNAGSGGFVLVGESDLPIFDDLNTSAGRDKLNFSREVREGLRGVRIYPLRLRAGDDASCLNLYQPRRPRLLGVPRRLIDRGGFHFHKTEKPTNPAEASDPWRLLLEKPENGVVPVFGEKNTVDYMLHSGLGDASVRVPDQQGSEHPLRIVGLLQDSVFQSELLTSEDNFLSLYPDHAGYNFFLIEAPAGREQQVRELLQTALADFGFEATPTRERLQAYLNVENTYLSTFQVLGSLGLLLGALGLAVVLLRNVWERRAELALLRALGYRPGALGWLVLTENVFLLLIGLAVGTLAALLSVAPHLAEAGGDIGILRLLVVLGLVLAVGLAAGIGAVRSTLQTPLLPALRKE